MDMDIKKLMMMMGLALAAVSCAEKKGGDPENTGFNYLIDQFADVRVMRFTA